MIMTQVTLNPATQQNRVGFTALALGSHGGWVS